MEKLKVDLKSFVLVQKGRQSITNNEVPPVNNLLKGIKKFHEIGRQKCFELGNPYYAKEMGDGDHYTKELSTGERYLVDVEILTDESGRVTGIKDTILSLKSNNGK